MNKFIESLDLLHFPLKGERLIEASAGTGKTQIITALYLRLLLMLGGKNAFFRPLKIEELLVMTFTEAATQELRRRIKQNIHDLRIACMYHTTNNMLCTYLLKEIHNKEQAAQWLMIAERHMNDAAVFTIHSFCQRMLTFNAFETGMLFEQQIIADESSLCYQACADFWFRYCSPLPLEIAKEIHKLWKGPEELFREIKRFLQGGGLIIKSKIGNKETIFSLHKKIITKISDLKHQWCHSVSEITIIINNSDINRKFFNYKNQEKYIEKISIWAKEDTVSYTLPIELEKFSQKFFIEHTKNGGTIPQHSIFRKIEKILKVPMTLSDLIIIRALKVIRETVDKEKQKRNILSFDDLLKYLDESLNRKNGDIIADTIRKRYPVAIIDEFQDTEARQYRIFRHIWYHQPSTALLLIGDPKQAIYTFRGADIFTYLKARDEVQSCYTLDTNWRSAKGLVDGVNTLFQRTDNAFMYREIPFHPVKSAKKNSSLRFKIQGQIQPAICFWLMQWKAKSTKDYQIFMAKHCAKKVCEWFNAGIYNKAILYQKDDSRSISGSDIAILVRNRQEAIYIQNELMLMNIPSIYLSSQKSVFETLEAKEILLLLQAVLSPMEKRTLRNALSSSILGLNTRDIDNLNNNKHSWNLLTEEFVNYRNCWQKNGIMVMIYNIISRRHIIECSMLKLNRKCWVTNVLHISELLQEASNYLESKYALVRWLAQQIAEPNSKDDKQKIRVENNKNLVQIVTIHKSKGLEYPIVWLPFITNYQSQKQIFYHDRYSLNMILDLNRSEKSMKLAEYERIAEDLRLLYVAITRPIWHCSLGIIPFFYHKQSKKYDSKFHFNSALGRLLLQGKQENFDELYKSLQDLCNEHISMKVIEL